MSKLQADGGMIVHSDEPLNAEPVSSALVANFYTPQDLFYIRNHGEIPQLANDHLVELSGLVQKPAAHCLADLQRNFPHRKVTAVLQCAGNRRADMQKVRETSGDPWLVSAIGNGEWTGASLSDVLNKAQVVNSRAKYVAFTCADEVDVDGEIAAYGVSITLERAMAGNVLIAWALNGEPLAPEHGAPMRIIVPDQAGVRSAKWIEKIEVRETPSNAPIQVKDYKLFPSSVAKDEADWDEGLTIERMPVSSAICVPAPDEKIASGKTTIKGYAVAYGRAVARVDVSMDGGTTWDQADLQSEPDALAAWTLWSLDVDLPAGKHELVVKAVDEAGQSQPEDMDDIWNFAGYLATAWHRANVEAID